MRSSEGVKSMLEVVDAMAGLAEPSSPISETLPSSPTYQDHGWRSPCGVTCNPCIAESGSTSVPPPTPPADAAAAYTPRMLCCSPSAAYGTTTLEFLRGEEAGRFFRSTACPVAAMPSPSELCVRTCVGPAAAEERRGGRALSPTPPVPTAAAAARGDTVAYSPKSIPSKKFMEERTDGDSGSIDSIGCCTAVGVSVAVMEETRALGIGRAGGTIFPEDKREEG